MRVGYYDVLGHCPVGFELRLLREMLLDDLLALIGAVVTFLLLLSLMTKIMIPMLASILDTVFLVSLLLPVRCQRKLIC